MLDGHISTLRDDGSFHAASDSNRPDAKTGGMSLLAAARHALSRTWAQLTRSPPIVVARDEPVTPAPAAAETAHWGHETSPPAHECRAAVERILASAAFASAPRLTAFLRFVVEAALAGRTRSIKAYTVALGALDRGEDFDPVTDPAVRVTAGRLRKALARYYAGPGAADPIAVTMPLGSYVPLFSRRDLGRAGERQPF